MPKGKILMGKTPKPGMAKSKSVQPKAKPAAGTKKKPVMPPKRGMGY